MVNGNRCRALYCQGDAHMYLLYSLLLGVYFVTALPSVLYRRARHGRSWGRLRDRLGRPSAALNPDRSPSIWLHAVSVGEVMAARSILRDLRETYASHRLLVSTTTPTGQQVARQLGPDVDGVFYAPLDLPPFVRSALDRLAPELLVVVDTEVWPHWLRECRRRSVKTVVINGRISDRSYGRYRYARVFMRRVLEDVDRVCAQTEQWGHRFVDLGLPRERMSVTGSLKFELAVGGGDSTTAQGADATLGCFSFVGTRPVFVAASTLDGEDEAVLRAFLAVRRVVPDTLLILAPRHPERAVSVRALADGRGLRTVARTTLTTDASPAADVVVLDTVGELVHLFRLATVVFVGGSLVPAGGHNIIEPAAFGKPIVFGPHMQNFGEIARLFLDDAAAVQVEDERELDEVVCRLFTDPVERARLGESAEGLVQANRGARRKTLEALADVLPPPPRDDVTDTPDRPGTPC